jgi:DNA-binding response OmpR family regulator
MAHIIMIEPDRLLAETYVAACAQAGHSLVPCASAQAAVLAADQKRPDVVIVELQLIAHSGIEFLYEFRSYPEWHDVPLIVHSQVPGGEFATNWQLFKEQLNIAHYLYKPQTSLKELLSTINQVLVTA